MEQQQRSLIFTAAVGLVILAIIVGSIYYLVKFIQSRVASRENPQPSVEVIAEGSASPEGTMSGEIVIDEFSATPNTTPRVSADKDFYNAGSFQVTYPKSWGILNCTNSANFELDPSGTDSKVFCQTAVKPVTVLVNDISKCSGETVKIGSYEVIKSKTAESDGYTTYQWCTQTDPVLNITHRVSKNNERATSAMDLSKEIEEMISRLTFVRAS